MLKNEKYYGTYIYNRDDSKKKPKRVLIEHFPEIRTTNHIPLIISKELFDNVQKMLEKRQNNCRPHQNASPEYVLTGLLHCRQCGKSMSGLSQKAGKAKIRYRLYGCPNHATRYGKTCSTKNINAERIEDCIKAILTESVNDRINCKKVSEKAIKLKLKELKVNLAQYSKSVAVCENQIDSCLKKAATTSGEIAEHYEKLAQKAIDEKREIEQQLNCCKLSLAAIENARRAMQGNVTLTVNDIFPTPEATRVLFNIFIEAVYVDEANDDIEIVFKS